MWVMATPRFYPPHAELNCSSLQGMIIFYVTLKHSQGNAGAKILGLGCVRRKKEYGEI